MILLLLFDLFIFNNTSLYSFCILNNIDDNNFIEVFISLVILFFLTHSCFLLLSILIIYLINIYFKFNSFYANILNYFLFILLMCLYFWKNIFIVVFKSFFIFSISLFCNIKL